VTAIHYFAYGSNMLTTRLRARTPSAIPLHRAEVRGRRLAFHKVSNDGSGKCDMALGTVDDRVIGVVFQLAEADLPTLDRAEGVGFGYERVQVRAAHEGNEFPCVSYQATRADPSLEPYDWYWQLVVAGLLEHEAPEWYLAQVRAVTWREDLQPDRAARRTALEALSDFRKDFPHLAPKLAPVRDA